MSSPARGASFKRTLLKRALGFGLVILLGILSALPNVLPPNVLQTLPNWYASNQLSLGLDLRGGSHLLLAIDTDDLMNNQNQQFADELLERLREAEIRYNRPQVTTEIIRISARDIADMPEISRIARALIAEQQSTLPAYTTDTQSSQITLTVSDPFRESLLQDALTQSLDVVRRRLDETGMVEPTIARQGSDSIVVQLPGVTDPQRIRELLGTTARMTFHWQAAPGSADVIVLPDQVTDEQYRLERRVAMEGRHVRGATMVLQAQTGQPVVNFRLDREGGRLFGDMTQENIGRPLAVVLDGEVVTAPVIRSAITTGSGEISGNFTAVQATDLAMLLRSGALPAALEVIEERTVGPNLGSDSIRMGLITGIFGALLVLAFMVAVYGGWGFIAWVGLSVNVALIFGVLSLLGATLTLPGIAGLILVMGMAVDANILINERIREELRQGKTAWLSLDNGFRKAYATIIDSNITTLIAISFLFMMGSGPVRGFAVTMGIGLLTSLFTAISVTRLLMEWRVRASGKDTFKMAGIPALDRIGERYGSSGNAINFMRASVAGLVVSALLSTISVGLLFKPGLEYGIDFSGGALLEVKTSGTSIEELRNALIVVDAGEVSVQEYGDQTDSGAGYLVRVPMQQAESGTNSSLIDQLKAAVLTVAPAADFPRAELVGPRVSGDFADMSILAVLLAGLGMLAYLWFRFENHFAIAAVITIALDLTKTIGFFALTGVEFNLTAVAALLALIGYSVNDKVVVFDRIRENLRLMPDKPLVELLNQSITATLTRTLFTSLSTMVAVLPMAIAGGAAVSSFALPMLFGIIISTSSSIFIAAPIVLFLGKRRERLGLSQLHQVNQEEDELEARRP